MTQSGNKLSSKLTTATLTALGLSKQPFSSEISGDRCFVGGALQDQLSLLMHNLRYSDHVQLLKGPAGIGKTTLLAKLVSLASGTLQIYIVRGHPGLQAEHVVRDMLKTLGESGDLGKVPDELIKLSQLLTLRSVPDVPVAIIIDDADQLPIAELEQLLLWLNELSSQLDEGVKILLLAKPAIEEMLLNLSDSALGANKVFHCELNRYDLSQVEQYIQHHLELVGFRGKLPLNHQHLSAILQASEGIPLLINAAAAQYLNENLPLDTLKGTSKSSLGATLPSNEQRPLLLSLIAIFLVIVGGTFFLETANNDNVINREAKSLSLPESPFKQVEAKPPVQAESQQPAVRSIALPEENNIDAVAATVPVNQPSQVNKPPVIAVGKKEIAPPEKTRKDGAELVPAGVTEKIKEQQVKPPEKVAVKQKVKPEKIAEKNKKPVVRINSETKLLLDQNPRHFTVQLIASRERRVIDTFMKTHKIPFRHWVFKTSREGKSWHVLVAGNFSGPVKARQSISKLPEGVRANGPWVRSFLSIQKAIMAEQ